MNKKNNHIKKSYIKYIFFFALILFLIGISISYAFYELNVFNTSSTTNIGISLQCMNINYSETDTIDLDYNYPVKDDYALENFKPVTITVTNNCTAGDGLVRYTLALSSLSQNSGYIDDDQIRMQATRTKQNEEKTIIRNPMYLSMLDEMSEGNALVYLKEDLKKRHNFGVEKNINSYIIDSNIIGVGESVSYEVYMWIDYYEGDISQKGLKDNTTAGKDFTAALSIITNDDSHDIVLGKAYAVYTESDSTLTFLRSETPINEDDTYNGKDITNVFTDFEDKNWKITGSDDLISTDVPWESIKSNITNVVFEDEIRPIDTKGWFSKLNSDSTVNLTNLDTTLVTDMSYMFAMNTLKNIIGLSSLNTSNVTNMSYMFNRQSYPLTIDISEWSVSNVTDMSYMFDMAQLNADLSKWDVSSVTNMKNMFGFSENVGNLSDWDTSNVTNMGNLFSYATINKDLGISSWDVSNVIDMSGMFNTSTINVNIDLHSWDVSSVNKFNEFSSNISGEGILTLPKFGAKLYAVYQSSNKTITFVRNENTIKVGDTYNDNTVTAVYTDFEDITYTLDNKVPWNKYSDVIENVNFDSKISPVSTAYWFSDFKALNNLNLANLNTSKTKNMSGMFFNVEGITLLDLSTLNTSNVSDMSYMFGKDNMNIEGINTLNLSSWNTSKLTNMCGMFMNVNNIVGLDNFDVSNVRYMSSMFESATINSIGNISNWKLYKLMDASKMFYNSIINTNIDLSGWKLYMGVKHDSFNTNISGSGILTLPTFTDIQ